MNLWMFIPQLASIVGDVKIVLLLRSHSSEVFSTRSVSTRRDQLRNSITTVPVRATAMATGFFLVYIFGAAVTNLVGLDVTSKAIALVIIGCLVNTLRHPLVALTTFRVFEEKEKRMQEIQRQKNLKREIEFARLRRLADQKVFVVDVETKF
ncbi:uncharacterized protein LOC131883881 [Tigriopus californicus]|uniref:uncharacterized protein LOC131883881 n=1 Tax=Tigriopus californicus TaxID=6832 RepID=UPI0027DA2386|nr:uncharacterized protein LOC131883881 [Tigriopus californicus]